MPLNFPTSPDLNDIYTFGGSSWIWNGSGWVSYNPSAENVVDSLNGLTGSVLLGEGSNITLTPSGNTIIIGSDSGVASLIAGSGITLIGSTGDVTIINLLSVKAQPGSIQFANNDVDDLEASSDFKYDPGTSTLEVPSVLSMTAVAGLPSYIQFSDGTTMGSAAQSGVSQIVAGSGISISPPSGTGVVTIDATGVAGGGVDSILGLTGDIGITTGLGIDLSSSDNTLIFTNSGVLSFNGLTGNVTGVTTGSANIFGPLQTFTSGIDSVGGTFSALTTFNSGIVATGATLSGTVSITGVITPIADTDAANKAYVDNVASTGIHYHQPVILASTDAETFSTGVAYDNGSDGVGATLTKTKSLSRLNVDGVDASNGERILVRSATDQTRNGIYDVTEQGSGSTAWILTRSADADNYHPHDQDGLGENDYFFVENGNTLKGHAFICSVPGGITFGTTPITFALFSTPPVYTAGTGLALNDFEFSNTGVLGLNGSTGSITLAAGDGITLSSSAGTITVSSTIWINMDGGNAFSVPIANFSLNGGTA